ncbi:hypothetical protein ABN028_21630 [Actinopolymorpha sp. B17G11]|uniref:hypothetical protein n=1 Tax=Actinopolymorpha sp. B17G11 TaxID=3160861 RepID=UPI0032E515BD
MTEELPPEPREPRRRATTWLVIAAVMLLVAGVGIGLWALYGGGNGPDYAADCRMIENEAPEFGQDMMALQQMGADKVARREWLTRQAKHLRELADKLTDREFARDIYAGVDAVEAMQEDLENGDMASLNKGMQSLKTLFESAVTFLDTHCERWLGPGQWGTPGTKPTGPTDFPTADLPTDFPTDLPSDLPTDFPTDLRSVPPLPSLSPTEDRAGVPLPNPSSPRVGQPFTAVVAKNERVWIPVRVTLLAVDVRRSGLSAEFDGMTVTLLRYKATHIGDRTVTFPEDPLQFSFSVNAGVVPAGPMRFAHNAPNAPAHCTANVEPFAWAPGRTVKGCTVAMLDDSLTPDEVSFSSGLPDRWDFVDFQYP